MTANLAPLLVRSRMLSAITQGRRPCANAMIYAMVLDVE